MINHAQRGSKAAGSATTATLTGGQIVVAALAALGVRHIFGVPGGQTLAINDAIAAEPRIEFITAHENAAACMADVVGRFSREPGVCLATAGPGATNLLTGIGGAFRDSSPASHSPVTATASISTRTTSSPPITCRSSRP